MATAIITNGYIVYPCKSLIRLERGGLSHLSTSKVRGIEKSSDHLPPSSDMVFSPFPGHRACSRCRINGSLNHGCAKDRRGRNRFPAASGRSQRIDWKHRLTTSLLDHAGERERATAKDSLEHFRKGSRCCRGQGRSICPLCAWSARW
jgi:hypothetical protein